MFSLPEITLHSELNVLSDDEFLIRELFLPDNIEQKERVALFPLPDIITSLESIRMPLYQTRHLILMRQGCHYVRYYLHH